MSTSRIGARKSSGIFCNAAPISAPVIWLLLRRFNLQALRNVATVEALLPFTGPIPTLSLAWIAARLFNLGEPPDPTLIETVKVAPGRYKAREP